MKSRNIHDNQQTRTRHCASSFIAIHCIIQLLEQGYQVLGTLRSMKRESELRNTLAKSVQADDQMTFAKADLLEEAGL